MITISSLHNEKIKKISRLITDNRFRRSQKEFTVEGIQENLRAMKFGYIPKEMFICTEIFHQALPNDVFINPITKDVYNKIAYRNNVEGIIGHYTEKLHEIHDFIPNPSTSIMVLEAAEKPGNIGAALRSCEAFGIDALVILNPKADLYNPNVIRSSVGCLFGMNVFVCDNEAFFDYLQKHQFNIYSTYMSESAQWINENNFNDKFCLIFGTEHSGISDFWQGKSENVLIPMCGSIDSLNLSNAVAICCYEVFRQKKIAIP